MASNLIGGYAIVPMAEQGKRDREVGARVTHLWKSLDYASSAQFARAIGIDPRRLNNVEQGLPLGKDLAFKMRQTVPGLTVDWLWFGDASKLPLELAERLGVAGAPTNRKTRS